ncbi:extracellular solute-binding protein [Paenibacillus mesophilus]|nr:extracellular solute-binding protein [Paenibacillus mesophilus]
MNGIHDSKLIKRLGGEIRMRRLGIVSLFTVLFITGCGGTGGKSTGNGAGTTADQPVTLSVFFKCFQVTDEEFAKFYVNPTKKKYPNITLQNVACTGPNQYKDMIVTNSLPDIIVDGVTNLRDLIDVDIPADLNELVKQHKFDIASMNKQSIQFVKNFAKNGELYSLPITLNTFATYYNKDIFDILGVPYPKDGMTWDDYVGLARKLTVQKDGVQYLGLQMGAFNRLPSQLSLPYVDAGSNKATIQSDGWRNVFETWKTIHDIPGNRTPEAKNLYSGRNRFVQDKNVAMFPDIAMPEGNLTDYEKTGGKWDIASFPAFKDKAKVGVGVFANGMVIPKTGKNKDAAFRVIANLLSDDAQTEAAKNGWMPILDKAEVQKHLLENSTLYKGKILRRSIITTWPRLIR